MEILIAFWLGVIISSAVVYVMCNNNYINNMYCNSSYNRRKDSLDIKLDKPKYKVEKVERCYCKNNAGEICKYTIRNFYITGKNKINCQELYFYDKIGAYNVGDILTLENLAKYNKEDKENATIHGAVSYYNPKS